MGLKVLLSSTLLPSANIPVVADRTRRFHDALSDALARFKNHQEALILRLPKSVRSITMAEFGDKYNGDVEACLRGLQRANQEDEPENITAAVRKRFVIRPLPCQFS